MKKAWFVIILFIILLSTSPCGAWIYYSDGPYEGRVLDINTGEPIEGAVVVGEWRVDYYGGAAGPLSQFCDAQETLTDKGGHFKIPRASCFRFWPFAAMGPAKFIVFKPGFLGYPPIDFKPSHFTGKEFDQKHNIIIKLGQPASRKERELTLGHAGLISERADEKLPILLRLQNEELKNLGIEGEYRPFKQ